MRAAAATALLFFLIFAAAFATGRLFFAVVAAFATFVTATAAATATLVDVAVSHFFFGRRTHFLYGAIEIQVLPSKWVVTVYSDIVFLDFDHADRDRALIGASLKLHADFERFDTLKTIAWHDLLKRWIRRAIAIFWSDTHFDSVASGLTCEGCFEARDDVFMTVKISQRLSRL